MSSIQIRNDAMIDHLLAEFYGTAWTVITMADDAWIGLGAAAGRLEFDDQAVDELNFLDCVVGIGTQTPSTDLHVYVDDATIIPQLLLEQDGTGDAAMRFLLTGGVNFSLGIDNSDGDKLKLSDGADVSTNTILTVDPATDYVGIWSTSPTCPLDVRQTAAGGAVEVLRLRQSDDDEPFTFYWGTAAAGNITRNLVREGDQAGQTRMGWKKIEVSDDGNQIVDQDYYVPFYTLT